MLANPVNSRDALQMRCIADPTPVDEETGSAHGFLAGLQHFSRTYVSEGNKVLARVAAHRTKLRMLTDCALENATALPECIGLTLIMDGDRNNVRGGSLAGGAPWGAAASFGDGVRLWTSTAEAGKYFAERGADVYDATISGGTKRVDDFLGKSKRADRIPPRTIIVVSDSYVPFYIPPRMNQFRGAAGEGRSKPKLFRESLLVVAFRDHGGDVFFEGYEAHSMYKWDPNRRMQRSGGVTPGLLVERRPGWVLRERGPGGVRYGVPPPGQPPSSSSSSSRRCPRRGPS